MTTFIEFHALRSFPPSNLNRDDLGTPKTAIFGGSRRLRISSQCLKRTWRTSDYFRGAFAEKDLGIRTDRLPEQVLAALGDELDDAAKAGLLTLLASIGKKDAKSAPVADDEEGSTAETPSESASSESSRTAHLLFLSRQEIETFAEFARRNLDAIRGVLKAKKKVDGEAVKKLRGKLVEFLEEGTASNAVDVGLFGRFVTSDEIDTVDAALQVAHAIGTQKVEVEYDYFTAVDDLSSESGAGHLGETEFASSVLYLYACCDLAQLEKNLGARSADGRVPDDEARRLARASLPALVKAIAQATPTGKKTGTAPHTPAEYVEVVVRRGAPLSFANAFSKPVDSREQGGDVMAASIERFVKHRSRLETAYGRGADVVARYVLRLRDIDGLEASSSEVAGIEELATELASSLATLPAQAKS